MEKLPARWLGTTAGKVFSRQKEHHEHHVLKLELTDREGFVFVNTNKHGLFGTSFVATTCIMFVGNNNMFIAKFISVSPYQM